MSNHNTRIKNQFFSSFEANRRIPETPRLIGPELEILLVRRDSGQAAMLTETKGLFDALNKTDRSWELDADGMGLTRQGIKFNPTIGTDLGTGTIEIGFEPQTSLEVSYKEVNSILKFVSSVAEEKGLMLLGYGIQPVTRHDKASIMPKERYNTFLQIVGDNLRWHAVTAANQVHIQVRMDELVGAINALNTISPAVIAMTANASVSENSINGVSDLRVLCWDMALSTNGAGERIGVAPRFESTDHYWNTVIGFEPFITRRGDTIIRFDSVGSLKNYFEKGSAKALTMDGKSLTLYPELLDAQMIQGCVWWEARATSYGTVEFRSPSLQPSAFEIMSVAALATGIVVNMKKTLERTERYTHKHLQEARVDAANRGLNASINGEPIKELAADVIGLAREGLKQIQESTEYLDPLESRVKKLQPPSYHSRNAFKKGVKAFLDHVRLRTD